jgi:50S ribosomal subunit-associated GTPase HflX
VERLLTELRLGEIPRLLVLNKTDLLEPYEADALARRFSGVAVSAARRRGLAELIQAAEERLGREKPLMKTYGEEGQEPAQAEVL